MNKIQIVFQKELLSSYRNRSALGTSLMFGLVVLATISLSLGGARLSENLAAGLFWVMMFFTFIVTLERSFQEEYSAGTYTALKIYHKSQDILLGKLLFNIAYLLATSLVLSLVYLVLMDLTVAAPVTLILTIILGAVGISGAGTLLSSMAAAAANKNGLFAVLMLPVVLPLLLMLTTSTAAGLLGTDTAYLPAIALYDAIIIVAASILFDYIW